MYKVTKEISLKKSKEVEICPFGDTHLGSKGFRKDKFKRFLEWAKSKDNVYLIGMGDLIDCIIPKDDRFSADEDEPYKVIDDLKDEMEDMLRPVKDKIICLLMGNHEYHMFQDGYGCPVKKICKNLGIKYGGFSAYIKLKVVPKTHQKSLIIWAHHGWFSGRKRGSKVNALEDNLAFYDANVYLTGHSHDLWATRKSRIYWGGSKDVIFANTGSFLETANLGSTSYSERANLPPQKLGVIKIKWLPYEEKIYVSE